MTQMSLDDFINSRCVGLPGPVEIVDATGRPLGQFTPTAKRMPSNVNPFTPEQLAEMMSDDEGGSLEEVWKRLGAK